jgi:hypothetical protein
MGTPDDDQVEAFFLGLLLAGVLFVLLLSFVAFFLG